MINVYSSTWENTLPHQIFGYYLFSSRSDWALKVLRHPFAFCLLPFLGMYLMWGGLCSGRWSLHFITEWGNFCKIIATVFRHMHAFCTCIICLCSWEEGNTWAGTLGSLGRILKELNSHAVGWTVLRIHTPNLSRKRMGILLFVICGINDFFSPNSFFF